MHSNPAVDVYSAREISLAAGVDEDQVRACLAAAGCAEDCVPHVAAVRIGRMLVERARAAARPATASLFSIFDAPSRSDRPAGVPLAVSGTLHVGFLSAVVFVAALSTASTAAAPSLSVADNEPMRLVFLNEPGPGGGGGGGGGGMKRPLLPPKALRKGEKHISSPVLKRELPPPVVERPAPKPDVIEAEPLPPLLAPIVESPADMNTRNGGLEQTTARDESRGPGSDGGVGIGAGTGVGEGDGAGYGPGSGGGTGGGPYRPGSGIDAPRLLHEVRADYTDEARRANVEGAVLLEIVVKRDGNVGDVRILDHLGSGLDQRAIQAVRQWRFAPARRFGSPVDVIVEVSVEFKLR